MPEYYLIVSSVTAAQRMQKLCRQNGIAPSLTRTPQNLSAKGCSYCLIVREQDYGEVCRLADQAGISVRERFVYQNGTFRKLESES